MELRPLSEKDAPALFALESVCFSCPWSENSFIGALRSPFTHGFGLFEGERLLGYAFLFALFEEGEVMNIAVAKEERGKGLSRILMDALLEKARTEKVEILRLEVRASNLAAKSLYESYGFQYTGLRKGYYSAPREDALLMEKRIP
jgi:ribosomal-protein-alanine N-acetyltransferase